MERHGGSASVRSVPGEGTEVRLSLPNDDRTAKIDRRSPHDPRTVVIVDDHAMFRTGVRAELGTLGRRGRRGGRRRPGSRRRASSTSPEVVLLDVHLPGGGGAEVMRRVALRRAKRRRPPGSWRCRVSDAAEDVIGTIRAGARGYVTKTITGPELVAAIERVAAGDAVFSPRLAGFVLDAFAGTIEVAAVDEDLDRLTEREREVMRLIARGYSYKEVGLRAVHLDQDRRDPHVLGAAQAAAVLAARADPVGERPPAALR